MKIAHIAIWSKDIEKLSHFYIKYFGAQLSSRYTNPHKKFASYFLSFNGETRIEIMQKDSVKKSDNEYGSDYLGLAHFALSVGSEKNVDKLTEQLKKDGYKILDGPRKTGDGYYESAVLDPERNHLEITI